RYPLGQVAAWLVGVAVGRDHQQLVGIARTNRQPSPFGRRLQPPGVLRRPGDAHVVRSSRETVPPNRDDRPTREAEAGPCPPDRVQRPPRVPPRSIEGGHMADNASAAAAPAPAPDPFDWDGLASYKADGRFLAGYPEDFRTFWAPRDRVHDL